MRILISCFFNFSVDYQMKLMSSKNPTKIIWSFPRSFFSTCFIWIAPSPHKTFNKTRVYVDVRHQSTQQNFFSSVVKWIRFWGTMPWFWLKPKLPPMVLGKKRRTQWYDINHLFVLTTKDIGRFFFQWKPPDFSFFEDGRLRPSREFWLRWRLNEINVDDY